MDMQMPVMDGVTAVKNLRASGETLPIIALTANVMETDKQRCLAAGFNDFITKPIDRAILYNTLLAHLPEASDPDNEYYSTLTSELENQSDEISQVINLFIKKLPDTIVELNESYTRADREQMKIQLHSLKGTGGSVGFPAISDLCSKLEFQIANQDDSQISLLLNELDLLAKRIIAGAIAQDDDLPAGVVL